MIFSKNMASKTSGLKPRVSWSYRCPGMNSGVSESDLISSLLNSPVFYNLFRLYCHCEPDEGGQSNPHRASRRVFIRLFQTQEGQSISLIRQQSVINPQILSGSEGAEYFQLNPFFPDAALRT
jgi:hypothetical protein